MYNFILLIQGWDSVLVYNFILLIQGWTQYSFTILYF